MIDHERFFLALQQAGVSFYSGVPDSLLKDFCAYVACNAQDHIIATNEGSAVALAIGHYMATAQLPLVYMQNSGLGNAINPLLSLADREVYAIPMLLMIGWRGEPGIADEPQHIKQGRVMLSMLEAMEIPTFILAQETQQACVQITQAVQQAQAQQQPVAIVVQKNSFAPYTLPRTMNDHSLSRETVINQVRLVAKEQDMIIATTGHASRELFELRAKHAQLHEQDFLTVGGMGHASHIALAVARKYPQRKVFCLDGDGALLMHAGAMATNGFYGNHNFCHIVINNGVHHSVGGQKTLAFESDLVALAKSHGYVHASMVNDEDNLTNALLHVAQASGPSFIEVRVNQDVRADLGRPTSSPEENKQDFMKALIPNYQKTCEEERAET